MNPFTGIPFFRILLPFVIGIMVVLKVEACSVQLFLLFLLVLLAVFFNFYRPGSRSIKGLFFICTDLFLFFYGMFLVQQKDLQQQRDYYGQFLRTDTLSTFIGCIDELPLKKEKFIKCEVKLLAIRKGQEYMPVRGTIFCYFKNSLGDTALNAGAKLLIKARLQNLEVPKNPFEFDYKNYLANRQIYHTAFIDPGSYVPLLENGLNPVWAFGLRCKAFILERLRRADLTPSAYGICAALLTGYDDDIEKPVIEAFSHSGTLHVLSVSGLHTGLLYLALDLLFDLFDPRKKFKLLRFSVISLVLWSFALITGFAAPVLRAVLMFTLLGFGKIYFRAGSRHQLNILLVSAFFLLVYNPFLITDLGFLLSYFALFGLIYFQPPLEALWQTDHWLLKSIWKSTVASVAATLSTLPFTLFYFKQFPLWFFVCNIVVIPATFVLLFLALLLVLKLPGIAWIVNHIIQFLIAFIDVFNSERGGFIANIHFTLQDAVSLSILLILPSLAIQYRSYHYLRLALLCCITWQILALQASYSAKSQKLLSVYNVRQTTGISVKNKTQVTLNALAPAAYRFHVEPHINSFNYAVVKQSTFNLLRSGSQSILFLDQPGFWPQADRAEISALVLSNDFKVTKQDLCTYPKLRTLVMDASNNPRLAASTEELCRNFGISFYNTRKSGAYLCDLQ